MDVVLDFHDTNEWWFDGRFILSLPSCAMPKITLGNNPNGKWDLAHVWAA
jgi:hypothetical protein